MPDSSATIQRPPDDRPASADSLILLLAELVYRTCIRRTDERQKAA